jgi:hypothetical protein
MKKIPDIIFDEDVLKDSSHKPKYTHSSASSALSPENRIYYAGECVMALDSLDDKWKGGVVQSVSCVGYKKFYTVRLSKAHDGKTIETNSVYGRSLS